MPSRMPQDRRAGRERGETAPGAGSPQDGAPGPAWEGIAPRPQDGYRVGMATGTRPRGRPCLPDDRRRSSLTISVPPGLLARLDEAVARVGHPATRSTLSTAALEMLLDGDGWAGPTSQLPSPQPDMPRQSGPRRTEPRQSDEPYLTQSAPAAPDSPRLSAPGHDDSPVLADPSPTPPTHLTGSGPPAPTDHATPTPSVPTVRPAPLLADGTCLPASGLSTPAPTLQAVPRPPETTRLSLSPAIPRRVCDLVDPAVWPYPDLLDQLVTPHNGGWWVEGGGVIRHQGGRWRYWPAG